TREVLKYAKLDADASFSNQMLGAELQLYLNSWLGAEGNYLQLSSKKAGSESTNLEGALYDFGLFFEVSLFRISGGLKYEEWTYQNDGHNSTVKENSSGRYIGVKVQF